MDSRKAFLLGLTIITTIGYLLNRTTIDYLSKESVCLCPSTALSTKAHFSKRFIKNSCYPDTNSAYTSSPSNLHANTSKIIYKVPVSTLNCSKIRRVQWNRFSQNVWDTVIIAMIGAIIFLRKQRTEQIRLKWLIIILLGIEHAKAGIATIKTYGDAALQGGADMAAIPSGGYYLVGRTCPIDYYDSCDMWVLKLNPAGNVLWDVSSGLTGYENGFSVSVTSNEGCVAAGVHNDAGDKPLVMRLDSDGTIQWKETITVFGSIALEIVPLSNGNHVVGGKILPDPGIGFILELQDSDQMPAWGNQYGTTTDIRGIVELPNNELGVVGNNNGISCTYLRLDTAGNIIRQVQNLKLPAASASCYGITRLTDDNLLIAGSTNPGPAGEQDALIIKVNIDGCVLWAKTVGTADTDTAYLGKELPNGNIIFGATIHVASPENYDVWVFITDSDGNPTPWTKIFGEPTLREEARSVCIGADGTVAVPGYTSDNGWDSYAVFIRSPFCVPGTYIDSTVCSTCPIGEISTTCDAPSCTPCNTGSYQDGTTPTECQPCDPGTYQNNQGQGECLDCLFGEYQPSSGQASCLQCHPLCKSCNGPTNSDCDACWDDVPHLPSVSGNTCDCSDGFFYDSSKSLHSEYCQPCAKFCEKCDNAVTCLQCIDHEGVVPEAGVCKCKANGYIEYLNPHTSQLECILQCHPLCKECHGLTNDECDFCDESKGAVFVLPNTCQCTNNSFYDEAMGSCVPCNDLCLTCTGPNSDQCNECNLDLAFSVEGAPNLCVVECEDSFFADGSTCKCLIFCP